MPNCDHCGAPISIKETDAGFEMDEEMFALYIKKYANRSTSAQTDAGEFLAKWKIVKR
jgi:hypothetical protein